MTAASPEEPPQAPGTPRYADTPNRKEPLISDDIYLAATHILGMIATCYFWPRVVLVD